MLASCFRRYIFIHIYDIIPDEFFQTICCFLRAAWELCLNDAVTNLRREMCFEAAEYGGLVVLMHSGFNFVKILAMFSDLVDSVGCVNLHGQ